MNNLFTNKFISHVGNKINIIKDILKSPCRIYANNKNNKNKNNKNNKNNNNKNKKKSIPLPKIIKPNSYFKYNKKHKKNNLLKDILLKDIPKEKSKDTFYHHTKETIPKRIRELVWTTNNGEVFTHKCYVSWCDNDINVFNFQVGHDIPESKGGTIDIDNLKPICSNCNLSMSNKYTIKEWSQLITNDTTKKNIKNSINNINNINNKK